jgi:flagellin-like hook-associated protein FlgL
VTTGSGTRSNIWTATGDTTTLTIEGETLTANAETVIGAKTAVSVISSGNIIQADGGASSTMSVVIAGVTVTAAGSADQNTRAANLGTAINANATLDDLNIKATASSNSSGQVTLSDPNARALALATAINNDVELAAKGVQAKATTDGTGFLSVGTLIVSGENATQPGGGKAINPTTKINISSDTVLGHISIVDSLTSPLMGFDVSQSVLGTLGETLIIPVSQGMSAHKEHMSSLADSIALSRTVLGSRLQRVTSHEAVLDERSLLLSQEVGDLSQANIEELITELTSLMVSRDASRQAYSMISQSSLFDFIK